MKLLPKWVMKRYLVLLKKFGTKPFDFDTAVEQLKVFQDSRQTASLVISDLKKAGWLSVEINSEDTRKRVYCLKSYELAFQKIVSEIESKKAR